MPRAVICNGCPTHNLKGPIAMVTTIPGNLRQTHHFARSRPVTRTMFRHGLRILNSQRLRLLADTVLLPLEYLRTLRSYVRLTSPSISSSKISLGKSYSSTNLRTLPRAADPENKPLYRLSLRNHQATRSLPSVSGAAILTNLADLTAVRYS